MKRAYIGFAVTLAVAAAAWAVDRHVPGQYETIQAAVDAAVAGDEVVLAMGLYRGTGNRDIDCRGKAVTIRSADPDSIAVVGATVIDCESLGRGFRLHTNEGLNTVISGLTITNGRADYGAAVRCDAAGATLANCVFQSNSSSTGGAVYVTGPCAPVIVNCRFTSNIATIGAAVCVRLTAPAGSPVVLRGCLLHDNTAAIFGGAVYAYDSLVQLDGCSVTANEAQTGGGLYVFKGAVSMTNCLIGGCRADTGGGVALWDRTGLSLVNCTIVDNYAPHGAALWADTPSPNPAILVASSIVGGNTGADGQITLHASAAARIEYSDILGGIDTIHRASGATTLHYGPGNINTDPQFAAPGRWAVPEDPNTPVSPDDPAAVWQAGDYHLQSKTGRWDSLALAWVLDAVTSRAVNSGSPVSSVDLEPAPNGGRINMGMYGNTPEASRSAVTRQGPVYVDDDGPADFDNIAEAVMFAEPTDTIVMMPGRYTGPLNRGIGFGGKVITLRSTDPNDPAVVAATVIDCGSLGRAFHFHKGEGPGSALDGMTITRGRADYGAAVLCEAAAPTIRRCVFVDNYATSHGALHVSGPCAPVIRDCSFLSNGSSGSAAVSLLNTIAVGQPPVQTTPVSITDCQFQYNNSSNYGGAIGAQQSALRISNASITLNSSRHGAAVYAYRSLLQVDHSHITVNTASQDGTFHLAETQATLTNCLVAGNRAARGSAMMLLTGNDVTIVNSTLTDNAASSTCAFHADSTGSYNRVNMSNSIIAEDVGVTPPIRWYGTEGHVVYCLVVGGREAVEPDTRAAIDWGPGNLAAAPQFAAAGRWVSRDQPGTIVWPFHPSAIWVAGDYHLRSEMGRWHPAGQTWILDAVTSPAINAGDPQSALDLEPTPNGGRINMGMYGNTPQASKSSIIRQGPVTVDDDSPADFDTIQDAVDFAESGGTIIVMPGVYMGPGNRDIAITGKCLTIRGLDPNDPAVVAATILNCNQGSYHDYGGFFFAADQAGGNTLAGLTILNARTAVLVQPSTGGLGQPLQILDCVFSGSSAGAVVVDGLSPVIEGCLFLENRAADKGGAVRIVNGSAMLRGCTFFNNQAEYGGAIYIGSAQHPIVDSCLFEHNVGYWSGAVEVAQGSADIVHCVFYGNQATHTHSTAVGGLRTQVSPMVQDCIFWANRRAGVIDLSTQLTMPGALAQAGYCCLQGWTPAVGGAGHIGADPRFAAPGFVDDGGTPDHPYDDHWVTGDYHLKSAAGRWDPAQQRWLFDEVTSPCIDAADPDSGWTGEIWPHGLRANMGIYGNTPQASLSTCEAGNAADLDHNAVVDVRDLALFAGLWLGNRRPCPSDLVKDGRSDLRDYALFARAWPGPFAPGRAHGPSPVHMATGVSIDTVLSWRPGPYAALHHVYLGISEPLALLATTVDPNLTVGPLERGAQYLWRIDEENADSYNTGHTWIFRTSRPPAQAANPLPANGATDVASALTLTWTAGEDTISHNVYLGTTDPPEFVATTTQASWYTGQLLDETTYYWRVDEVNTDGVATGPVWRFTTLGR